MYLIVEVTRKWEGGGIHTIWGNTQRPCAAYITVCSNRRLYYNFQMYFPSPL